MTCLPAAANRYYLFHSRWIYACSVFAGADLLYSVIDMNANGGLGKVVAINQQIRGCDIGGWPAIAATRHANGSDWWLLSANQDRNRYFRMRLTPEGLTDTLTMTVGNEIGDNWGNGQNIFSPDGSKYIDCRNGRSVRVYDFDRCSGMLGAYQDIPAKGNSVYGLGIGAAISKNSRYLYLASPYALVQADLWADDIASTADTLALVNGFYDESIYHICFLGFLQLMPDGRIYGATPGYNYTRLLHCVYFPNRPKQASKPLLHHIRTPISAAPVPTFPNYRLGPLDGSSCDTLGIDNLPLAHFRWALEDSLSPLSVAFSDLSFYEPASWHWDFGDDFSSQETSPVHVFPAPGTYTVCLTVCNANACDTVCKDVTLGLSGAVETAPEAAGYQVWPNPAREVVRVAVARGVFHAAARIQLFNQLGQKVAAANPEPGTEETSLSVRHLPTGIYFLVVSELGQRRFVGKVVVVR